VQPVIHRIHLPLRSPLRTAIGDIRERTVWLVNTGSGWGEAAPLPGFGGESPEQCELALDRARSGVEPSAATPCAFGAFITQIPFPWSNVNSLVRLDTLFDDRSIHFDKSAVIDAAFPS